MSAAEHTVIVGGAAMYPSKDIIVNAIDSKNHTTLVAAVKAADLQIKAGKDKAMVTGAGLFTGELRRMLMPP